MNRALLLVLWSLTSGSLLAQDAPDLPVITEVTSVVNLLGRGFHTDATVRQMARVVFNVSIGFADLPSVIDQIRSITVSAGASSWNLDPDKTVDLKRGVFRLFGLWGSDEASAFGTLRGRSLRVKVNLTEGRSITRDFTLPLVAGATEDTRFYVSEDFTGLVTPYHVRLPSVTRVQDLRFDDDELLGEFSAVGHSPVECQVIVFDSKDKELWTSPILNAHVWLNGGQGLSLDGTLNRFRIPVSSMGNLKAKPAVVVVRLSDPDTLEANRMGWAEGFVSYSGKYLIGSGVMSELVRATPEPSRPPLGVPVDGEADWRAWSLRLNGILGTLNNDTFGELAPSPRSEGRRAAVTELMRTSWGISDRRSLLDNLQLLKTQGHRARFGRQLEQIQRHPDLSDDQLVALFSGEGWSVAQLRYVRMFAPITEGRSLLAWDYCRAIMLVRYGFYLGYLSEDEAWSMMEDFAEPLGRSYRSWGDLGEQFIVGRMYWAGADQAETYYLAAHEALLKIRGRGGIWYQAPWPTPASTSTDFVVDHP